MSRSASPPELPRPQRALSQRGFSGSGRMRGRMTPQTPFAARPNPAEGDAHATCEELLTSPSASESPERPASPHTIREKSRNCPARLRRDAPPHGARAAQGCISASAGSGHYGGVFWRSSEGESAAPAEVAAPDRKAVTLSQPGVAARRRTPGESPTSGRKSQRGFPRSSRASRPLGPSVLALDVAGALENLFEV